MIVAMTTEDIAALLIPGIRKASKLANAHANLVMDLETNSLWLNIMRAGAAAYECRLLLTENELLCGSYKSLFNQRLQEIFGE